MNKEELVERAYAAREMAYAPYSKYKVGAAILTEDGYIYTGCNIENSSYGATVCAERTAALKAVSDGHTKFAAIAIVSISDSYTFPCGICRQFLGEFMADDGKVYLHDKKEGIKEYTLGDLIPNVFRLNE